jgi:LmbE family N-acetylglucosaminyl deacetylase
MSPPKSLKSTEFIKQSSPRERRRLFRRFWLRKTLLPTLSRPFILRNTSTLIVSPHQDDETLGCGGLIAMKRQLGAEVTVVFVTDGSQCTGELLPVPQQALVALRRQEALSALNVLGVPESNIHFLNFPDARLKDLSDQQSRALQEAFFGILDQYHPTEIYLPHRHDSHPDHEATYRWMRTAVVESRTKAILYEYPVWLLWSRNRLFVNLHWNDLRGAMRLPVDTVIEQKYRAMNAYPSQLGSLPAGFVAHLLDGSEFYFRSNH